MCTSRTGQATLSLVLLIGGIAFAVSVMIALLSLSALSVGFGADAQERARSGALAGTEDAALRLARNPDFASAGYTVAVEASDATVVVQQNTPITNQVTVTATASAGSRAETLTGIFGVDEVTGVASRITIE